MPERATNVVGIACSIGYRNWSVYPSDVQDMLIEEYNRGEHQVNFGMVQGGRMHKYTIDFEDMKQINAYTNKSRKIRLIKAGEDLSKETFKTGEGHLATTSQASVAPVESREVESLEVKESIVDAMVEEAGELVANDSRFQYNEAEEVRWEQEEASRQAAADLEREKEVQEEQERLRKLEEEEERQRAILSKPTESTKSGQNQLLKLAEDSLNARKQEKMKILQRKAEREKIENNRLLFVEKLKNNAVDPKYKLIFNNSKRSESLRLLMLYTGEPFEEAFMENNTFKNTVINSAITIHDDHFISRSSSAMMRYLGIIHHLYPTSYEDQAEVDDIIGDLREFTSQYLAAKDAAGRDQIVAESMMMLERQIASSKGPGLFDELSIADFELVSAIKALLANRETDRDQFEEAFVNIMKLCNTVWNHESIYAYDRVQRQTVRESCVR